MVRVGEHRVGRDLPVGASPAVRPTEFFRWWIVDERTGKRRRTTYKLTRADAERQFSGAEPDLSSREVRVLPAPGESPPANSKPGRLSTQQHEDAP